MYIFLAFSRNFLYVVAASLLGGTQHENKMYVSLKSYKKDNCKKQNLKLPVSILVGVHSEEHMFDTPRVRINMWKIAKPKNDWQGIFSVVMATLITSFCKLSQVEKVL